MRLLKWLKDRGLRKKERKKRNIVLLYFKYSNLAPMVPLFEIFHLTIIASTSYGSRYLRVDQAKFVEGSL